MNIRRMFCVLPVLVCLAPLQARAEGKFVPPPGKTILVIGQNIPSIDGYVAAISTPAGFMTYTSVRECEGLDKPFDNGAGELNAQTIVDRYPDTVLQIGLYLVDSLDQILAGEYDANIDRIGAWIAGARRPVYLRIGYEFDSPENRYEPEKYVAAYRYIVDRLRRNKVENAAYVWHSFAGITERKHEDYYPGDDYVDWFGVSYFENQSSAGLSRMVQLAREHGKPLMVAEATPAKVGVRQGRQSYFKWFRPLFRFVEKNDVRMLCYINTDWDELPMFSGMQWGDSRVQDDPVVKQKWLEEMSRGRYLQGPAAVPAEQSALPGS